MGRRFTILTVLAITAYVGGILATIAQPSAVWPIDLYAVATVPILLVPFIVAGYRSRP